VAVETARAELGSVEARVDVVGTLTPKREAEVKTEYSGTIAQVYVTEWSPVRKGTPLARLDTREAEAALLQVKAEAQQAAREYERAVKLKEAGLMTQQGLEAAETLRDAAAASLELAQTRLDKAVIRSPMDGVVSYRGVNVGDYVENMGASPMFKIVDNRLFDLVVTVPATKIHLVRSGQGLSFTADAVPGQSFEGKVAFINPAADESSRAIRVQAEVLNETGELKAGLFVKGTILCGERKGVLLVPKSSLMGWDLQAGTAELFVEEGDTARRRSVKTGATSDGEVEISQGLKPGEAVVTRGAFNLQDGDKVVVEGSGTGDQGPD
jgi:RND family efflux transporter MFP subunit